MPSPILVLNSQTHYVADGSTTTWDFNFAGGYISKDHVKAYTIEPGSDLIIPIPLAEPDIGEAQVSIIPAITDGASLVIYRDTPKDMPLVDYTNGQGYDEASLDTTAKQAVFIAAEVLDRAGQALNVGGGVAELQELLLGGSGAGLVGYFNAVPYPANTVGSGIKAARDLADSAVDTAEAALAAVDAAVSSKASKSGDTFTGPVTVPELKLDATSSLGVSAGSVNVLFDTGDGLIYNRATNTLDVNLGGSRMTVSAAAGPERTSDAITDNGLPRKSQMDAAIADGVAGVGVPGAFTNLKLSATGTSAPVTVTADAIVVSTGSAYKTLTSVSLTPSLAVAGANGLDTGASATNTWYSVWVIWNGTTTAGLLSLSETAPTMPSGYTHKARVGWIRTDGTGNKYPLSFKQVGRRTNYKVASGSNTASLPVIITGAQGSATTPTWVSVSIASTVPPTASMITAMLVGSESTGFAVIAAPNNSFGAYATTNPPPMAIASGSPGTFHTTADMVIESSNIYYASTNATVFSGIRVVGWEDNL